MSPRRPRLTLEDILVEWVSPIAVIVVLMGGYTIMIHHATGVWPW